jgi:hypothetical protein
MLDAFIIEQLRKETEEVQPLPLTLELPNFEEEPEKRDQDEKKDRPEIAAVIRF